jgi:biopolymer transport protein ExbB
MNIGLFEVVRSSPVMIVLLLMSVLVFTIVMERFWYLRSCTVDASPLFSKIREFLEKGSFNDVLALCDAKPVPLTRVIKTIIANRNLSRENVEELAGGARLEEKAKMEKYLLFLGSMGAIGPLLGLLGTVIGLSRAFKDLALSGSAGPSVVAAGISEALFATIAGLAIAIPTVLMYNYLMGKTRRINTEIEVNAKKLVVWLFSTEKQKRGTV